MSSSYYHERSAKRLVGVHPVLVEKMWRVLAAMDALGFPMFVTQGLRTAEEQAALYAQGRSTPGPIVTNCDGVTRKSNHQAKEDGLAHAVDCAFVPSVKLSNPFADQHPWSAYGACVLALDIRWGGAWQQLPDRPHAELPMLPPSRG